MFKILEVIKKVFFGSDLRSIDLIDLNSVEQNMVDKHGWSWVKTREISNEYRQFLKIVKDNPDQSIVPWSQNLDDFWHQHILDTEKYIRDCRDCFGYIVHHDPNTTKKDLKAHKEADKKTTELRKSSLTSSRTTSSNKKTTSSSSSSDDNSLLYMMGAAAIITSDNSDSSSSSSHHSSSCSTSSHSSSSCSTSSSSSCGSSSSSCGSSCGSSCSSSSSCGSSCGSS